MSTSLLLHFNGANGSTTFTDSSSNELSVTGGGNAQLSTAQFKFGGSSALFDGNGDSLQLPSSSELDFGTGPFTVEFWMRTNGGQDNFSLLVSRTANAPSTGGANVFGIGNGTSAGLLEFSINATSISTSNAIVNDGNWHHVAVSRSGTNMWLGVDGTIVASSSSLPVGDTTTLSSARIGRWQGNNLSDNNYNGYLDEFRVTKGEALYTAAYTVPIFEFDKTAKVVFLTTVGTGTFTIPSDFVSLVSVEAIGGGGSSNDKAGGGGGAYAKSTTMAGLFAGGTAYYQVGAGGTNGVAATASWFNPTTNAAPTANLSSGVTGVLAAAGTNGEGTTGGAGGDGGTVANSTGDLRYAGGNSPDQSNGGGNGGGGAAGPGGAGGDGGNSASNFGGAGGGSGATLTLSGTAGVNPTSASGTNGGASSGQTAGIGSTSSGSPTGTAGSNGGGGGGGYFDIAGSNGGAGGNGSIWTQTSNSATAGPGGGGGGTGNGSTSTSGSGGFYGGGAGGPASGGSRVSGAGGQGIIVFTYEQATKTVFLTATGAGTFITPKDFVEIISVEAIGGGASAAGGNDGANGGGGGGAYAKSTSITGLQPRQTTYYSVGIGGVVGAGGGGNTAQAGGDSWFNVSTNAAPTLASQGVLAKGGSATSSTVGGAGGAAASCVGDTGSKYSGGNGGNSGGGGAGNGGGGGAAGPGGAGGNGGNGSVTVKCAGGGGGGASLIAAGNNGGNASGNDGGAGGNGGSGTGGGTGGVSATSTGGSNGTAGTGGGGGGNSTTNGIGGNGGTGSYWTSSSGATAGSGGGGGGTRDKSAGNGGLYGGGGAYNAGDTATGKGGQGIIVIKYSFSLLATREPYQPITGFTTTDNNTDVPQDLGSRYITKDYLLDVYPNIASSTGNRVAPGLWSWGTNARGELGIGNTAYYSSPVQVGSLTNWKQVSNSNFSSAAIKKDGTLWTWGSNNSGSLGNGNTTAYSSPVQIGALTNWKQVVACAFYMIAIKTDGTLWAWGNNTGGQLGNNNRNSYSSPVQIGALTNWKQVSTGGGSGTTYSSSFAITNNGALWAWGSNIRGALGINSTGTSYYSSPVQVGALTNWKQVAPAGGVPGLFSWCAAVKTDGTLWAWGANWRGQLGLNHTGQYYSSPVQVGSLTNWKQVSTGGGTFPVCAAVKTDGTLWTWGNNRFGQLGLGFSSATVYYSSPVQVGSLTNWKQISVDAGSGTFMSAIKTDGTLWSWGQSSLGELGLNISGATAYYSSPVQVGSLTNWRQVSVSDVFSLAIQDGYI